jgi:hypothetical protein
MIKIKTEDVGEKLEDQISHGEISGSHGDEYKETSVFWDVAPCSLVEID